MAVAFCAKSEWFTSWGQTMTDNMQHIEYAKECLKWAEAARNSKTRADLLSLAQTWLEAAFTVATQKREPEW